MKAKEALKKARTELEKIAYEIDTPRELTQLMAEMEARK